jgi:hypothetical protein
MFRSFCLTATQSGEMLNCIFTVNLTQTKMYDSKNNHIKLGGRNCKKLTKSFK